MAQRNENAREPVGSETIGSYTSTPVPITTFLLQQKSEARKLLNGGGIPKMASFERDPFTTKSPVMRKLSHYEERLLENGVEAKLSRQQASDLMLPRTTFGESMLNERSCTASREDRSTMTVSRSAETSSQRSAEYDMNDSLVVVESLIHPGAHRDGYSESKCRYVLVTQCARIARQFNYAEGVKRIYPVLREYVGDENLDLMSGVLYELIEIPVDFQWEEGGMFQRWKHDHRKRDSFAHLSTPALGNVIVGTMIPTEPLRRFRRHQTISTAPVSSILPSRLSPTCTQLTPNSQTSFPDELSQTPSTSIRSQKEWQIDYSCFVSSPTLGTNVHKKAPTPADLHLIVWDATFGRGGRFIQQREILVPDTLHGNTTIKDTFPPPRQSWFFRMKQRFIRICQTTSLSVPKHNFHFPERQKKSKSLRNKVSGKPLFPRTECACDTSGHASIDVQVYEKRQAVSSLPEPSSLEGKKYYSRIHNHPLPDGFVIPTEGFVRKNELVPKGAELAPATLVTTHLPFVEDLVIRRYQQAALRAAALHRPIEINGPFTNELFKDGGMDYKWDTSEIRPTTATTPDNRTPDSKTVKCGNQNVNASDSREALIYGQQIHRPNTPLDFARLHGSPFHMNVEQDTNGLPKKVNLLKFAQLSSPRAQWSRRRSDILEDDRIGIRVNRDADHQKQIANTIGVMTATRCTPRLRGGEGTCDWETDADTILDIDDNDCGAQDDDTEHSIVLESFPAYDEGQCSLENEAGRQDTYRIRPNFGYARSANGILVRQSSYRQSLPLRWPLSLNTASRGLSTPVAELSGQNITNTGSSVTQNRQSRPRSSRYTQTLGPTMNARRLCRSDPAEQRHCTDFPSKTKITLEDPFFEHNITPPTWLAVQYTEELPSRLTTAFTSRATEKLNSYLAHCTCANCQLNDLDRVFLGLSSTKAQSDPFRITSHAIFPWDSTTTKIKKAKFNNKASHIQTQRKLLRGIAETTQMDPYDPEFERLYPAEHEAWKAEQAAEAEHDDNAARLEGYSTLNDDDEEEESEIACIQHRTSTEPRRVSSLQAHTQRLTPRLPTSPPKATSSATPNFSRPRAAIDHNSNQIVTFIPIENKQETPLFGTRPSEIVGVSLRDYQYPIRTSSAGVVAHAYTTSRNTSIEHNPKPSIREDEATNSFDHTGQLTKSPSTQLRSNIVSGSRNSRHNDQSQNGTLSLQFCAQPVSQNRTQRYSQENESEKRGSRPDANYGVTRSSLNDLVDQSSVSADSGEILLPLTYQPPASNDRSRILEDMNVYSTGTTVSVRDSRSAGQRLILPEPSATRLVTPPTSQSPVVTGSFFPYGERAIASADTAAAAAARRTEPFSPSSVYSEHRKIDDVLVSQDAPESGSPEQSNTTMRHLFKKVTGKTKTFLRKKLMVNIMPPTSLAARQSIPMTPLYAPSMDRQSQCDLLKFLEHSIRNAAGIFLSLEFLNRRISIETLAPIEKEWKKHNTHVPKNFYYSVEYQRRILKAHVDVMNFRGGYSHRSVEGVVVELGQLATLFEDKTLTYYADDEFIRELMRMATNVLYILGAPANVMSRISILKNDHEVNVANAINRRTVNPATPYVNGTFGLTPTLQPFPINRASFTEPTPFSGFGDDHDISHLLARANMKSNDVASSYAAAPRDVVDITDRPSIGGIFADVVSVHSKTPILDSALGLRGLVQRSLSRRN